MPQHEPTFHYRVGWFAQLVGSAEHREIVLAGGVLRLARRDGSTETLVPDDVVPQISRSKGLCWDSLSLSHRDGRHLSVAGIRRAEAQSLRRMLEAWVAPVRERYFAELGRKLEAAEALAESLLRGSRFVRSGDVLAVAEPLREAVAQLALLFDVPGGPSALVGRYERLRWIAGSLRDEVAQANERFVSAELTRYARLFDTVESKPLTAAQRRACVVNDDHNLVLAGAGTGKTSVMIGRVGYLLSAGLADGSATLMVAYNRDAAREMRERVAARLAGVPGAEALTIKTFHALGKEILAEVDGVQPAVSPLAEDDAKLQAFVTRLLDEALNEPEYAGKFIEYGFDLHEPHRALFDFKSLPEYERELAKLDLRTLNGERVKSGEELRIANFLMRNGVEYAYEQPFPIETADREHRQYRPDFTIRRDDPDASPLFLEHFGVDGKGNPPSFFNEAQAAAYREGMRWKRAICQQHQLTLIETYSYQFRPEVVFDRLTAQLVAHGVPLLQRSDAECLDILRGSAIVTETARLFAGLIPIIREHGLGQVEIGQRIAAVPAHERARAQLLWELLRPIVEGYERHLASTGEIDFADMIGRAAELVRSGQYRSPFTHLLVDEFQDISGPRASLILALSRQRADSTVFCVGDDWQSIYRFTGSDVRYISQFETLVGSGTTTALDRTFRFNNQIGQVAAAFVMRNPAQVRKVIESVTAVDRAAVSLVPTAEPHRGLDAILRRIDSWGARAGERYSVYVLARYWYELEELEAHFRSTGLGLLPNLGRVEFRTVHGVKGREVDFVIIAGLEAGPSGFPADKPTDPFHEMFLPPKEAFEFADERRLFYVALTRARHRVYLLFDAVSHSPFVRELRDGSYAIAEGEFSGGFVQAVLPIIPCPRCATGEVRPTRGEHGLFYACHRFPACRYRERGCGSCGGLLLKVGQYRVCSDPNCNGVHLDCPKCGAPMEHRSGPYGAFFGCSNFGRVDLIEQCAATEKWRQLPAADELRGQMQRSTPGS